MATVALDRLWFNDAADPSDARGFFYAGDSYDLSFKMGGGVEDGYASGRSRGYSTEDDTVSGSVTLENLSSDDRDWLKAHRGRPACFRDHLGHKVFVQYQDTPFKLETTGANPNFTCSVSLSSVSFDQAV